MKRRKGCLVWGVLAVLLLMGGVRRVKTELRTHLSPVPTEVPIVRSEPTTRPAESAEAEPELPAEPAEPEETSEPTPEPTEEPEQSVLTPDTIRPDFQAAMDSYEAFYDEYCELCKAMQDDPTNLTFLSKYGTLLAKEAEMSEAFEAWESEDLTDAEMKYYLAVNLRVQQKLLSVY